MKKIRFFAGILATCMLALGGCGENSQQSGSNSNPNQQINYYVVESTVNVLQEQSRPDVYYDSYSVTMVKNEYESQQIILTPEYDVSSYDVSISNFTNANGDVLNNSCFEVYNEKYIDVTTASAGASTGIGAYADALLPMSVAKEYKENKISGGKNQGLWITAYCPKEQPAGVYHGNITVTADDIKIVVPATVSVLEYTLTDNVTAGSIANMSRHYFTATGDDTIQTYKEYYDYLLEYRLSAHDLPVLTNDNELFIETLLEYAQNPKMSTYTIPYEVIAVGGDLSCDFDKLDKTVWSIVECALENNINLLEKAALYYGRIADESELNGTMDRAIRVAKATEEFKDSVAEKIRNNGTSELHEALANSIQNLPVLFTDRINSKLWNNGDGVQYYCPQLNCLAAETERKKYQETGNEYWWYTATGPHNPYPNWHIDSEPVGMRMLSWMQENYGVSGFLYWDVVYWKSANEVDGNGFIDPFTTPVRYGTIENGDGWLLYPGSYYNMGPIGSTRLHRIRDGLEEYEMLAEIENACIKHSGDAEAKSILDILHDKLYIDAKIRSDGNDFMEVRAELLELATLYQNFGVSIAKAELKGSVYSCEVYAPQDVTIIVDGKNVASGEIVGDNVKYLVEVELDKDVNALDLSAKKGDKQYGINVKLGGAIQLVNGTETEAELAEFTAKNANKVILNPDVGDDFFMNGYTMVEIDFAAATDSRQCFILTSDKLSLIDERTHSIMFDFFSYDLNFELEVLAKIEGESIMRAVGSYTCNSYYNSIELTDIADINWEKYAGKVESLYFYVGAKGDNARRVFINDIVIRQK